MYDKAQLGNRYACYECGTKFYDLNRPTALCPECNADQVDAPARDIKALLSSGRRRVKAAPVEEEETPTKSDLDEYDEDLDADDGDDELGELELE